jgi:hypothetical protein
MGNFISQNIVSEGGLTGNSIVNNTLICNSISATTIYGDGTNITNVTASATPGGPNNSIQYNNNGTVSGSTSLLYSGGTLFFTGTTRLDGLFHLINSSSAKLKIQWFGAQSPGTAPGIIWTNMPAFPTTWLHQSNGTLTGDATFITDLTEYTQCRLFTSLQVAGFTSSQLAIQYSFDNSTWVNTPLVQLAIGNTTGAKDSGWVSIPVEARTFVYIRLGGFGGNGIADPRFSPPILLIR